MVMPELNQIYHGDCLSIMKTWPDQCIDLVVTSPPYNLGEFKKGSHYSGKTLKGTELKYEDHSDTMDAEAYVIWQHLIIRELFRLIRPTGAIFYNHKPHVVDGVLDDRRNLIPLSVRQEIVWDRCCMINFSGSFFAPQTERIFIIAGPDWVVNKDCVSFGDVWRIPPETNNPHPAPCPVKLAKRAIQSSCPVGGVVYDPFMGSGTTAVAAVELGRQFLGTELTETYIKMANARIAAETSQGKLF